jgi:hypothetical protein
MSTNLHICKTLAPEDLRPGMDITVLQFVREYTPLPGCFTDDNAVGKTVRWNERPRRVVPPLRVVGVCLPLVLAEDPLGVPRTLDVRAVRLARLDEAFAALYRERIRAEADRRRKRGPDAGNDADTGDSPPGPGVYAIAPDDDDDDE